MTEVRIHCVPTHVLKALPRVQVVSLVDDLNSVNRIQWCGGHATAGSEERWQRLSNLLPVNLRVVLTDKSFELSNKVREQRILDHTHLPPMDPHLPTHTFWKNWNNSRTFNMPLTPWILVHRWHHAMYHFVSPRMQHTWIGKCLSLAHLDQVTDAILQHTSGWDLRGLVVDWHRSNARFMPHLKQFLTSQWYNAIAKGVICARSVQQDRLNPQDTAAEFFTAQMLQPRKWQTYVANPEMHLPTSVTLDWAAMDRHTKEVHYSHQTPWSDKQKVQLQWAFDQVWRSDLKMQHAVAMRNHLLELNQAADEILRSGNCEWVL